MASTMASIVLALLFCGLESARESISQDDTSPDYRNKSVVGMNWGRGGTQKLLPSVVADLFLQNAIPKARLFSCDPLILKAFAGTEVDFIVTVPNGQFTRMNKTADADAWVVKYILPFADRIKYVLIGNAPFSSWFSPPIFSAIDAMQLVQDALNKRGLGEIKATLNHFTDVLRPGYRRPSDGAFNDEVKTLMVRLVQMLQANKAPVMLNVFPLYVAKEQGWDLEFSFFDGKSNFSIQDRNGLTYTNTFDTIVDTFLWALKDAGAHDDLDLIVSEVGWPTDGDYDCTGEKAKRFYDGLVKKIANQEGTPLKPGHMEVYIYNLLDENNINTSRGNYFRHRGVFTNDGYPKFQIDFSGQRTDLLPFPVRGDLAKLPKRWCVFNNNYDNKELVEINFAFACQNADCSSLGEGASCSNLTHDMKVSYAFNMYFQARSQDVAAGACTFDGLGRISYENPTAGQCEFPLQIVALSRGRVDAGHRTAILMSLLFITFVLF